LEIKGAITGILPVFYGTKIVGPAFTVKEVARKADVSEFRVTEALNQANSGDVIVFDVEGYTGASTWGGLASLSAKMMGIEGVIVNGAVRDVDEIREMRFPVFTRAVVPITGKGRIATTSVHTPIKIDCVQIHPKDLVIGDDSGITIIPHGRVEEVLKIATEIMTKEEKVREQIRRGKSAAEAEKELKIRI
jgi:regulator of RNase E activity RraA